MKSIVFVLLALCCTVYLPAQNAKPVARQNWMAGFMTDGASSASFRHFILLPNGTIGYFAPGQALQPFPGIEDVVAISAGTFHMLAIKKDGTVWAWGRNDEKQLGNETLAKGGLGSKTPVEVTGLHDAVAVSAFGNNSYALLKDGTIRAWGYGNVGMTGDGKPETGRNTNANWSARGTPVKVAGINTAVAIAGPMALLQDGTVMTWGDNYWGQLGNGDNSTAVAPVAVKGLTNVAAIACRDHGALVLLKDGTVWAWGANEKGQLGRKPAGDNDQSNVPVRIQGISDATAIDASSVCIALLRDGSVKVWGWGAIGGMASGRPGTNDVNPVPLKVAGISNAVAVKSGNGYATALHSDGTVMGWGVNMMTTGVYHQTWTPVKIASVDISNNKVR
jgi:alpha-tubulin suppressor-like RCC1 family protein